jgi:hypothetical protein
MAIYKKATTRYGVSALVRRYVSQAPPERISGQNGPIPMILLIDLHAHWRAKRALSITGAAEDKANGDSSVFRDSVTQTVRSKHIISASYVRSP